MKQSIENQALERFHLAYLAYAKKAPSKPADPPPPVGTIFAGKMPVFSILLGYTLITLIKTLKPLKIKGLGC